MNTDKQKTCKHCGKKFNKEHIWMRHQYKQCPKKSNMPVQKPDFRQQIHNSEILAEQIKKNGQSNAEALKFNKSLIMLKNTNPQYTYHCKYCNEGFEFQSEINTHQQQCYHRPKNTTTPTTPTSTTPTSTQSQLNQLKLDIQDIKQTIHNFRKDLEILYQVKQQLLDLKDIAFHLRLFKISSLKSVTQ